VGRRWTGWDGMGCPAAAGVGHRARFRLSWFRDGAGGACTFFVLCPLLAPPANIYSGRGPSVVPRGAQSTAHGARKHAAATTECVQCHSPLPMCVCVCVLGSVFRHGLAPRRHSLRKHASRPAGGLKSSHAVGPAEARCPRQRWAPLDSPPMMGFLPWPCHPVCLDRPASSAHARTFACARGHAVPRPAVKHTHLLECMMVRGPPPLSSPSSSFPVFQPRSPLCERKS
jgi:hypothetical protein